MIRKAKPEDTMALVELGRAFHAEADRPEMGAFDPQSFCEFLDRCTAEGVVIVAEKGREIVGMILLLTGPAYWNKAVLVGQETAWYVRPAHRNGVGAELLNALESASKARGVSTQFLACEEGQRSKVLARVYRKRGYRPIETMFAKKLEAA